MVLCFRLSLLKRKFLQVDRTSTLVLFLELQSVVKLNAAVVIFSQESIANVSQ